MLEVVVDALLQAEKIAGILLVSDSTRLDEFTSKENTIVLATQTSNLKDAVTKASVFATDRLNCSTTFIVPADLPLISGKDIDYAVTQHQQLTILPDARLTGTNGIIATPPNALEYVFNGRSFHAHQNNARASGLQPKSLQIEAFSYDVDTFEDLLKVIQLQPESRTAAVFRSFAMRDSTLPSSNLC